MDNIDLDAIINKVTDPVKVITSPFLLEIIKEHMKAAIHQALVLASEYPKVNRYFTNDVCEGNRDKTDEVIEDAEGRIYIVDKQSILDVEQLIK